MIVVGKDAALIIVDVQNDFCPGGALPVAEGDRIIPVLNRYVEIFRRVPAQVFATRDWHPRNHISFKDNGGSWPPHCIQGTPGAEYHKDLELPRDVVIVSKATHPDKEAYSGFEGTGLAEKLRSRGVRRIFVGGLATDYCVKNTVLDGLKEGFQTYFLSDASRAVNVKTRDGELAVEKMLRKGALKIELSELKD